MSLATLTAAQLTDPRLFDRLSQAQQLALALECFRLLDTERQKQLIAELRAEAEPPAVEPRISTI